MDDFPGPFLFARGAERAALLGEGLAREVLAGILVPSDVPITRSIRARAVRAKLGHREIHVNHGRCLGFSTAAWLHTGACAGDSGVRVPARLDLVIGRNRRSPRLPDVRVRQVDVPPEQVQVVEGVLVTGPVRTAADIARDLPRTQALPVLRLLQEMHDVHPPQVIDLLQGMPYARGAAVARFTVHDWAEMA